MNTWTYYLAVADLLYLIICSVTEIPKLSDEKILKYEPVYYSREHLDGQCQTALDREKITLNFTAYSRDFNLILYRDKSQLSITTGEQKNRPTDVTFIYRGIDTAYSESRVYGKIEDGRFEGTIQLSDTKVYHLVPSHKLFTENVNFHSIIYAHHDYHFFNEYTDVMEHSKMSTPKPPKEIYNYQERFKRQTSSSSFSSPRQSSIDSKVCSMKLTADHTVWKFILNLTNQNEVQAEWHIIYLLLSHVEELNRIYSKVLFPITTENSNGAIKYLKLQFYIKDIEILKDECITTEPNVDAGPFCTTRDPQTLLQSYADRHFGDYDYYDPDEGGGDYYGDYNTKADHCLVFLFTARDLRHKRGKEAFPVLGAALPFGADGICQHQGNFAFITFCQYNEDRFLSPTVTQLVFAHEVTHAMGAPHDDNKDSCGELSHLIQPEDGYYLMHSIAQIGKDVNNRKLSNCSMAHLVNTLSDSKYTECFTTKIEPHCGNRIVEEGEECDCGHDLGDDPCCHGYNITNPLSCKLKQRAKCSPSNGPCCDKETCDYIGRGDNLVCQRELPCVEEIYCNGEKHGALCPPPSPHQVRPDGLHCSQYGRVCDRGSCNKSICDQINWRECQVTNLKNKLSVEEKEELCFLGCQPTKHSECVTSHNETQIQFYPEFGQLLRNMSLYDMPFSIQFPIGWPCNENKGYCDSYHRCRGTQPDTPLVMLKNCFINGDCFQFIRSNLFASILLIISMFVIVPVLLAKCCAIHTKSSNPILERKHPKQTVRESLHRISAIRESVNLETLQHSFHNMRNSLNLENLRHSFRHSRTFSRPTSQNVPDVELNRLNSEEGQNCDKTEEVKVPLKIDTEALSRERH